MLKNKHLVLREGGANVEVIVDLEGLIERLELGNVLIAELNWRQGRLYNSDFKKKN